MLKVFLVEDEIGIRESIRDTLDWSSAGFEYLGDAPDGEIAFKEIREKRPDIVITDIKMPFMDGLELSKLIRDELPETRVVILSGHDDFAYAQKAIRLGVSEYLTKPISPSELMQAVNRVAVDMRRHMAEDGLGEGEASARKRKRDAFLHDLLTGVIVPSEIFSGVAELGLPFFEKFFLTATVKTDAKGFDLARDARIEDILASEATSTKGIVLARGRGGYVVVFQGQDEKSAENAAVAALSAAAESIEDREAVRVFSGIGGATERLHELSRSLGEAESACNYSFFTGASMPHLNRDIKRERAIPGLALTEKLDRTKELLLYGSLAETREFASSLGRAAAEGGGASVAMHYAYIDLLMTIAKVARGMDVEMEKILPAFPEFGTRAFAINTPRELEAAAAEILAKVVSFRQSNLANRYHNLLAKAKQFIDDNFADSTLSLQRVAQVVHVSPTHFSAVFSRETRETFSDYLAKVRMDNAMRLLKTTPLSAAEISEKVGYNDPQYFSRVFKRTAGMSIRSFRKRT